MTDEEISREELDALAFDEATEKHEYLKAQQRGDTDPDVAWREIEAKLARPRDAARAVSFAEVLKDARDEDARRVALTLAVHLVASFDEKSTHSALVTARRFYVFLKGGTKA